MDGYIIFDKPINCVIYIWYETPIKRMIPYQHIFKYH